MVLAAIYSRYLKVNINTRGICMLIEVIAINQILIAYGRSDQILSLIMNLDKYNVLFFHTFSI